MYVLDYWRPLESLNVKCMGVFVLEGCLARAIATTVHVMQTRQMSVPGYYPFCEDCADRHRAGVQAAS